MGGEPPTNTPEREEKKVTSDKKETQIDPLAPDGPLAASAFATSGRASGLLKSTASNVLARVSASNTLAQTERPGSRAAARVMEEGTTKVFIYDPLNADALAELLGRRDGDQVMSEGRAAIANGWRLVFGGQSKKWGCSVASIMRAEEGAAPQAARPRTAIMTRHQLPVVLGEDQAAYGFVLRLEAPELAAYERARHSRRNYDRIPLRVLARQRDGRSFAEELCVAYVLRPEPMALFTAPNSVYLDALRSTLRAYWQLDGLLVRDGTGRQVLDWEEPHGAIQYEDDEPLKRLMVSVGEQRRWKASEADRSVQKLHAVGIYDIQELAEALGGGPRMKPQTLNRRLRKAGFKIFGKEALALLMDEIKNAGYAEGGGGGGEAAAASGAAAGAGAAAANAKLTQGGEGNQPARGSDRVARAMGAAADGDTGVETQRRSQQVI